MYTRNSFILLISICVTLVNAYWGDTNSGQYHIQTDEGPERYFRYQTDNGQFRKEKRLQDGTVIGTDAWIDASGYLRQKDYIADTKGYRILKSRTVFVGDRPIQEAMKFAKQSPPQAGILIPNSQPKQAVTSVYKTTTSTTVTPLPAIRVTQNPTSSGYDYPSPKSVFIRPHSQAIDSNYLPPNNEIHSTTTERPSYNNLPVSSLEPPYANSISPVTDEYETSTPIALYPPSSSYKPEDYTRDYGPPISVYPSTTVQPISNFRSTISPFNFGSQSPEHHDYSSTLSPFSFNHGPQNLPPSAVEGIDNELLPPNYGPNYGPITQTFNQNYPTSTYNNLPIVSSTIKPVTERIQPINNNNIDNIQPLYSRPHVRPPSPYHTYQNDNNNHHNHKISSWEQTGLQERNNQNQNNYRTHNDLQSQNYPLYDGISQTQNGFQYYLPQQYHEEEENVNTNKRTGSFGYIDPFGIRRVVYYNTSPGEGFSHRKNNRFVGFNSTPYDPKPPTYLRQEN